MKRWARWMSAVAVTVLVSAAAVRADVTVVTTTTIEGGAAAMMGGAGPKMTVRVKGTKARSEVEMMGNKQAFLFDLATKQMFMLNPADNTARVVDSSNPAIPPGTPMPSVDVSFKPTGLSKMIDNINCDEYAINMAIDMSSMGQAQEMPPEAAEMMKGVKMVMTGSSWIAKSVPGAAEYLAFQKTVAESGMTAVVGKALGGGNGMEKLMSAAAGVQGIAYLTEMTMNIEGSGQLVDMMRQMGAVKMTQKVTSVSTETLPDDLFKVPADYKIVK